MPNWIQSKEGELVELDKFFKITWGMETSGKQPWGVWGRVIGSEKAEGLGKFDTEEEAKTYIAELGRDICI